MQDESKSGDPAGARTHAAELLATLDRPIHNRTLGKDVGRGELDYEVYLKTQELYALQNDPRTLSVPDEHLFQVMHQTQELWLKAVAFEVVPLIAALDADDLFEAFAALERIGLIQRCLAEEIRVLHTLTPDTFLTIRRNLGNGSGLESPGFNRVLLAATAAEAGLDRLLQRHRLSVVQIYDPKVCGNSGVKRIAELFVDWDSAHQSWLMAHFLLVRRTMGVHRTVRALDGFPTNALPARMMKPLFEKLWDARVEMTQAWIREGGHAPGAPRASGEHPRVPDAVIAGVAGGDP